MSLSFSHLILLSIVVVLMSNIFAISAPVILDEKYRRYRRDNRFSPNLSFKKVMASLASKSSHSKSFDGYVSSSFVMLVYDIFAKVLFYIECSKYILFIFRSVLFQVTPVTCFVSLKCPK